MLFRTVLVPFIQIFQWSGLSPFPLDANKSKSFWRTETLQFAAITVVNLLINLVAGIHILSCAYFDSQPKMGYSKLFLYTHVMQGFILRTNAISALIESLTKRSIQTELLSTFDEIENIFAEKLNFKLQNCQIKMRFTTYVVIWIVKNTIMAVILILSFILTFDWYMMYLTIVTFMPFFTSTLSNAHWMIYVDVIRFNIERLNTCLMEMRDNVKCIDWHPTNEQIFDVKALPTHTMDACERLVHLRSCFSKMWQASLMINDCFRWSFFINNGNDLYVLVVNLFWIFYRMMHSSGSWIKITFYAFFAGLTLMKFVVVSVICEDINAEVSSYFRRLIFMLSCNRVSAHIRRTCLQFLNRETHETCPIISGVTFHLKATY